MHINIIGLGKMGTGIALNLLKNGYKVNAYDPSPKNKELVEKMNGHFVPNIDSLPSEDVDLYWVMVPSGEITKQVIKRVLSISKNGDIIIDAGNSHFSDSQYHFEICKQKGIDFFDIGTSGGVSGATNGACMMVGGDKNVFSERIENIISDLCVSDGYHYCGKAGSGHYLKMVHNGIEYGMMQAIAEGFNLLYQSNYNFDLRSAAKTFNNGSVIRSWLMELVEDALTDDSQLEKIRGVVDASGEGQWAVEEALKLNVSLPVITQALYTRYDSKDEGHYTEKLLSAMRNKFGGHKIYNKDE